MLQALQLTRRRHLPRVEPLLIARRPCAHLLDVGVRLRLLPSQVARLRLRGDEEISGGREPGFQRGDLRELGQGTPAVRQLVEPGVERLQVEQALLVGGSGVQRGSSVLATCAVHASVTVSDTRTSTVAPASTSAPRSRAAAATSHGHSVAQ